MPKSIKQLRSDLTVLDTEIKLLATELYECYGSYIIDLNNVLAKQLILACYQVCTQQYPDNFLALSYQQKTDLQDSFKSLSKKFLQKLSNYLTEVDLPQENLFNNFPLSLSGVEPLFDEDNEEEEQYSVIENIEDLGGNSLVKVNSVYDGLDPREVIRFFGEVEESIRDSLTDISVEVNNVLGEYNILPSQVPAKILEMALQAKDSSTGSSHSPNLLSLMVEKEDVSNQEIKDITSIVALCLRLGEIEFSEPNLSGDRRNIIVLLDKLISVKKRFERTKNQFVIASAEAQWRSCWSDDE